MKKILAFLLAVMLLLSLAACGGKDSDKTLSGGEDKTLSVSQQTQQPSNAPDPGTDEPANSGGESDGQTAPDEEQDADELLPADEALALYGFTVELAAPAEDYTELMVEKSYSGDYHFSFIIDGDYMDGHAYVKKIFQAIEEISDDGKVYALDEAFLSGTGKAITVDEVKIYNNRVTMCYFCGGKKMMVEAGVISIPHVAAVLSCSVEP